MKSFLITCIGVFILVITSCSLFESRSDPALHDSIEIDIDENGITDYTIKYSNVDIEPISISGGTFGIIGALHPNGLNEILRKAGERSLFLRNIDNLKETVIEPLAWTSSFSRTFVSITTTNAEGDWPNNWEINSESDHSTYFFGLKMVADTDIQLAWVEIEIGKNDGEVSIVNKGVL